MDKKMLLVDGNSLGWASFYAQELSHEGFQTGMIFQFLVSLRSRIDEQFADYIPVVLWDGKSWRKDVYPSYKEKRDDTPEKQEVRRLYHEQKVHTNNALNHLGVMSVAHPRYEADDLAAIICRNKAQDPGVEIALLSGDEDWLQLVGPGIVWTDHRVGKVKIVGLANFDEHTKVKTIDQFVEAKCLMGDKSDEVSGVGGLGEKYAKELVTTYGSVQSFLEVYGAIDASERLKIKKVFRNFAENVLNKHGEFPHDVFERNLKLMDLRRIPDLGMPTIYQARPNIDAFRDQCQMFGFNSILDDFDNWVRPFTKYWVAA
jgi:5'-3' exonuclease